MLYGAIPSRREQFVLLQPPKQLIMSTPKSVAFHTLGCKLNFAESSALARKFENAGYLVQPFSDPADVYVINTCSVTDFADRKCRKVVRQALRQSPDAKIVVTGCYAQLKPEEIAEMEGVDLVLGAAQKFQILDYVETIEKAPGKGMVKAGEIEAVNSFHQSFSFGDRTRSFLKIQDGCDYNCSFCTIPLARGMSRSSTVEAVVEQACQLEENGIKEIVLTGVNIGDFGNGTTIDGSKRSLKKETFLDLIKALDAKTGIPRYRISSIEPNLCGDEIIEFVAASDQFMPHFHMPLQSGNNKQLAQMRRRYRRELYQDRVETIKSLMPHACIGVDVIVGFPGETMDDFRETIDFLESLDISYFHVFTYSERPNTPAANMKGTVPVGERRNRNKRLRKLSEKKRLTFYRQHLNTDRPVLFEKASSSRVLHGFTDNYIKIEAPADHFQVNHIREIKLGAINNDGLVVAEMYSGVI